MGPHRRTVLALLVLTVALLAGAVAASPPSAPVCEACGHQFRAGASEHGQSVTVIQSTLDVHLRANGTTRRVVRNRVNAEAADHYRDHPHELRLAVRAAFRRGHGSTGVAPSEADVRVEGRTVVVTTEGSDVTRRSAGLLVYDRYLTDHEAWWTVNADRFTIHAPSGYQLAGDPGAQRTNGSAATWTDRRSSLTAGDGVFTHRTIVAVAPEGTVAPGARAWLAGAIAEGPTFVQQFLLLVTPVALVLGGALGLAAATGAHARRWDERRLAAALAVLGGVGLAWGLVLGEQGDPVRTILVTVGAGALALSALGHPRVRPDTLRRAVPTAAALAGGAALVLLTLAPEPGPLGVTSSGLVALVPVVMGVLVLSGLAGATGHRTRWAFSGAVLVPYVAIAVRELPVYGGLGLVFYAMLFVLSAVLFGVLAVPLYWFGAAIGGRSVTPTP